jgi:hypothetical protein
MSLIYMDITNLTVSHQAPATLRTEGLARSECGILRGPCQVPNFVVATTTATGFPTHYRFTARAPL